MSHLRKIQAGESQVFQRFFFSFFCENFASDASDGKKSGRNFFSPRFFIFIFIFMAARRSDSDETFWEKHF